MTEAAYKAIIAEREAEGRRLMDEAHHPGGAPSSTAHALTT